MRSLSLFTGLALSLSHPALSLSISNNNQPILKFTTPDTVTADSLHNIHLDFLDRTFEGDLHIVYGDCSSESTTRTTHHHSLGTLSVKRDAHPKRLVWITPSDAPHLQCIHAFSPDSGSLLARSNPISISTPLVRREPLAIADYADAMGPWFDGVAYMQAKEPGKATIASAKNSSVAIVGGGMSGLMTSLLLSSVGMHNWHIHEASQRVGGRIRTQYLNNTRPDQYQYQEMGPMRFPVSITYAEQNETLQIQDHRMVFQLADTINKINAKSHPELKVNFIEFVQNNENVPASSGGNRLANGRIPTAGQVAADPGLVYAAGTPNDTVVVEAESSYDNFVDKSGPTTKEVAKNIFRAHKTAVDNGLFHWSEASYLNYALGYSENVTDYIAGAPGTGSSIWSDIYDNVYFAATKWRTIDKGLESLPRAIYPHVANKTTFGRKVDGLKYNEDNGRVAVTWRDDPLDVKAQSEEYDYAVVAAPFSKVRLWDLPRYSSLLSRAIDTMNYSPSCKLSLLYESRFWEHQENPIFGGCGEVDVAGVGSVCYPSFNMNGTGPGVILASYISGTDARSVGALSDEDYVGIVQRALIEFHGEIAAKEFTGIYNRQCWEVDEHQAGAWASPFVGQQDLYLPAYYNTEFKTIFIGEHTSYTHAWIFSALDSAIRGTTQLLLDLGLVDEAKQVVNEWMGRWIKL